MTTAGALVSVLLLLAANRVKALHRDLAFINPSLRWTCLLDTPRASASLFCLREHQQFFLFAGKFLLKSFCSRVFAHSLPNTCYCAVQGMLSRNTEAEEVLLKLMDKDRPITRSSAW